MSKLKIFNKMMSQAKSRGYSGCDYKYEIGFILNDTNIYSLVFREDFAKALWGEDISLWEVNGKGVERWQRYLKFFIKANDKWKFLDKSLG